MPDTMDVDLPPDAPPPDTDHKPTLLRYALHGFIRANLTRALGADMAPLFQPPPNATLHTLLRFLLSKWIGVFADSALRDRRPDIEALLTECAKPPATPPSREETLSESLLLGLGRRTLAARGSSAHAVPVTSTSPSLLQLASGPTAPPRTDCPRMPVVLDGSNLAWAHGQGVRFSIRGAAEGLHHYSTRGHPTVLFLPEARLQTPPPHSVDRAFFDAIIALKGKECLVTTPARDYDDAYLCHFARKHGAVVVSNDSFRDHVYQAAAEGARSEREWERWFRHCRVSFTFRGHEFIPNPAFNYSKAVTVASDLAFGD